MAINVTEPTFFILSALNTIPYSFTMTDPGTPPIVKSFGYQLVDNSGNPLGEEREIPYTSEPIKLDFRKDLQKHVSTTKPDIFTTSVQSDTTIGKSFRVKYWEWNFNTDDCTKVKGTQAQTLVRTVFNGAFQWFNEGALYPFLVGYQVLSNRPANTDICNNKHDWLYIWVNGSYSVRAYGILKGGGSTAAAEVALPNTNGVNIVPIGGANGFYTSTFSLTACKRMVFELRSGGSTYKTYNFDVDCCTSDRFAEVAFLEPPGGYGVITFDSVEGLGISRTAQEVLLQPSYDFYIFNVPQLSGRTATNTEAYTTVKLRKVIPYSTSHWHWIEGFLASSTHLISIETNTSIKLFARFVLNNGEVDFYKSEEQIFLEVSGKVMPEIISHNYE